MRSSSSRRRRHRDANCSLERRRPPPSRRGGFIADVDRLLRLGSHPIAKSEGYFWTNREDNKIKYNDIYSERKRRVI